MRLLLRDLLQKASSLSLEDAFYFVFSIKKNQEFIIELNTQKQMFEDSVNSDNVILGTYSPLTYQRYQAALKHIKIFCKTQYKNEGFSINQETIIENPLLTFFNRIKSWIKKEY